MPKINIKKTRPKTRAQLVEEKRRKFLKFNQPEFLEEERDLEKLFLDEGLEDEEDEGGMSEMEEFVGQLKNEQKEKGLFDDFEGSEDDDEPPEEFSSKLVINNRGKAETNSVELPAHLEDDDPLRGYGYSADGREDDLNLNSSEDEGGATAKSLARKKRVSKKRRVREMRKTMRKVDEGIFEVDMGGADFKVVALETAKPSQFLNPRVNFREELLRLSTQKSRLKGGVQQNKMLTHARKWRNL